MATIPESLIWELVKTNNSFLVKQFGNSSAGIKFSREKNNLYNIHSSKYSGLANRKTVTIEEGENGSILLATTKKRKHNKPSNAVHKVSMKREFPRMVKTVLNKVVKNGYRSDLKWMALARLSAVNQSIKEAKAGAEEGAQKKKKNKNN